MNREVGPPARRWSKMMSETLENEAIAQALQIIDRHLSTLNNRELVSTSEVSDLLLDMRSVLAAAELEIELERTTASAAN
ncbi:MAG TPA: hypothetical protein VM390_09185 [Acidimicrobiales bacterium]|nr:hypothetical protein [Acidimicrobiales bacterium]